MPLRKPALWWLLKKYLYHFFILHWTGIAGWSGRGRGRCMVRKLKFWEWQSNVESGCEVQEAVIRDKTLFLTGLLFLCFVGQTSCGTWWSQEILGLQRRGRKVRNLSKENVACVVGLKSGMTHFVIHCHDFLGKSPTTTCLHVVRPCQ